MLLSESQTALEAANDETLMGRVKAGEGEALELLYDKYVTLVMSVAVRVVGNRAVAEEVVQETFWRVWSRADSFSGRPGKFKSWMCNIARRHAIDRLRRDKIQSTPLYEMAPRDQIDPHASVSEAAGRKIWREQIQAALLTLPAEQQDVIKLAYFHGLTHREIARMTDSPVGTVHTRARLAQQKLRDAFYS